VQSMLGVDEKVNMTMHITKIMGGKQPVERHREEKPAEVEDANDTSVPFQYE
jgi:hypothetical protein